MSASQLKLPERRRSYRFALTPLADAMFQLLIFFMLTSSLSPYSLLTLKTALGPAQETQGAGVGPLPSNALPSSPQLRIWRVTNGAVTSAGQRVAFEDLAAHAQALSETAGLELILLVQDDARVQDITTVLEKLQSANVVSVQIQAGET